MSAIEYVTKSQVYANAAGRRGNRARLVNNFSAALHAIEQSAAAGATADRIAFTRA
jgi:hypothetical protein